MVEENGSAPKPRMRPVSSADDEPKVKTPRGGASGLEKKPVEGRVVDSIGVAAFKLRLEGKRLWEIAEILDVTENEVELAINSRMKTERALITSGEREGIIALQDARYEAMIAAHWPAAMMGDDKSSAIILKTMHQKEQLLQLAALDPETSQRTVLVIGGKEADYVRALKEASGQ